MHSKRLFQGSGLPPSNAVFAHPQPGAPPLPPNYHQAKKGCTTFFFNFPLPQSSPNSIDFGKGLARIFYEIRATVAVCWKGERTSVRFNRDVVVVECLVESRIPREPSTLVAEGGKMVVQAQVVGGIGVTGRPSCVELQVKNHSQKKVRFSHLTDTILNFLDCRPHLDIDKNAPSTKRWLFQEPIPDHGYGSNCPISWRRIHYRSWSRRRRQLGV